MFKKLLFTIALATASVAVPATTHADYLVSKHYVTYSPGTSLESLAYVTGIFQRNQPSYTYAYLRWNFDGGVSIWQRKLVGPFAKASITQRCRRGGHALVDFIIDNRVVAYMWVDCRPF